MGTGAHVIFPQKQYNGHISTQEPTYEKKGTSQSAEETHPWPW